MRTCDNRRCGLSLLERVMVIIIIGITRLHDEQTVIEGLTSEPFVLTSEWAQSYEVLRFISS